MSSGHKIQYDMNSIVCDYLNTWTVHSPLFFCEIVEIQRALQLMAAMLIFECTEGAGVGDYSSRFFSLPPKPPSSAK